MIHMLEKEQSVAAVFPVEPLHEPVEAGAVISITCGPTGNPGSMDFEDHAQRLADLLLEHRERVSGALTMVLDVCNTRIVPLYVDLALTSLVQRGLRVPVIVMCDGESSLDSESSLPPALLDCVDRLNRGARVWDPRHRRFAPGRRAVEPHAG